MGQQDRAPLILKLDILISMMEQVNLKKENYIEVMRGVKMFVSDKQTQKKGYKILAKVIEKYELQNLGELAEIKTEITPMMKGQATKQRLHLIKAFLHAMSRFKENKDQDSLSKILELVKSMVIELITAINNSNIKIRKLAEESFKMIQDILSPFKA